MPGQSAFTLTLYGPRSFAAHCMKLISAAFDALYGGSVCEPICPATDAISSIDPARASRNWDVTDWTTFTAHCTLMFITRGASSGVRFQNGNPNLPEPMPTAKTR